MTINQLSPRDRSKDGRGECKINKGKEERCGEERRGEETAVRLDASQIYHRRRARTAGPSACIQLPLPAYSSLVNPSRSFVTS